MGTHPPARRAGRGAAAGLLSGAVAVGAGQLVAGITGATGSPVVAAGQLQIDLTPPALKNFAISAFGSHDKLVLVSGILVVLALVAAVLGILAMRRLGYGLVGLAVFAVIGAVAAATRPGATAADVLPHAGRRGRRGRRDGDPHPRGPRHRLAGLPRSAPGRP